jgi:hypothetical protein
MHEGWLIRDGEVLASALFPSGWRARLVSPRSFPDEIGAVAVVGPAVVVGTGVARPDDAGRLRSVRGPAPARLVGPGRHAIALRAEVTVRLRAGELVELRVSG